MTSAQRLSSEAAMFRRSNDVVMATLTTADNTTHCFPPEVVRHKIGRFNPPLEALASLQREIDD